MMNGSALWRLWDFNSGPALSLTWSYFHYLASWVSVILSLKAKNGKEVIPGPFQLHPQPTKSLWKKKKGFFRRRFSWGILRRRINWRPCLNQIVLGAKQICEGSGLLITNSVCRAKSELEYSEWNPQKNYKREFDGETNTFENSFHFATHNPTPLPNVRCCSF